MKKNEYIKKRQKQYTNNISLDLIKSEEKNQEIERQFKDEEKKFEVEKKWLWRKKEKTSNGRKKDKWIF